MDIIFFAEYYGAQAQSKEVTDLTKVNVWDIVCSESICLVSE